MEKRLELLRAELNLSWGELCDRLGIGRSMLAYLRSGARNPSMKLLRKIIEAERAAGIAPLEPAAPPPSASASEASQPPPEAQPPPPPPALARLARDCAEMKAQLAEIKTLLHDLLAEGGLAAVSGAQERGAKKAG